MTHVIFILGMHRSGTSMMAGILEKVSVFLGERDELCNDYNNSTDDNIFGYKENVQFQEINNQILSIFGSSWDKPKELEKDWLEQLPVILKIPTAMSFLNKLIKQASKKNYHTVALKDPRASLIFPFWEKVIQNLALPFSVIWCVRNPIDVAKSVSLRKFHTRSFEDGINLWKTYNQEIYKIYRNTDFLISFYEDWFGNSQDKAFSKLISFFECQGVNFTPCPITELPIVPESKHYSSSFSAIAEYADGKIVDLYNQIHLLAKNSQQMQSLSPNMDESQKFEISRQANTEQANLSTKNTNEFVKLRTDKQPVNSLIKLIAFYLPQFHPIPENDMWWGEGFTEWTNVRKAKPRFKGHNQPRIPGDLGYYDLRMPEIQERQVELAKLYGIYGFCFYIYWFAGKRLLEKPVNQFVENKALNFPFCFCWANENWTRRWDGREQDILIAQQHSRQDDLNFITEISQSFTDPRYIRFEGKPLLIIYRISLFPDPSQTIQIWRDYCHQIGIGDIFVVAAQTFGIDDPLSYACDAAVEFPPLNLFNVPDFCYEYYSNYNGQTLSFSRLVSDRIQSLKQEKPYKQFYTTIIGWDNTPRRPNNSTVFPDATPELYAEWLKMVCQKTIQTMPADSAYCFINAWNEWAEGTYLEPDQKYGYAFLEATAQVLAEYPLRPKTETLDELYLKYLVVKNNLMRAENALKAPTKVIEKEQIKVIHLQKSVLTLLDTLARKEKELLETQEYARNLRKLLFNPVYLLRKVFIMLLDRSKLLFKINSE